MLGFRKYYFYSRWNQFDIVIVLLSLVDLIVDEALLSQVDDVQDCGAYNPNFSLLKIAKVVRLVRLLRSLRLVKVSN